MGTEEEDYSELWKQYRGGSREAYEKLVDIYLPMVKITVGRIAVTIPTYIDRDELYSAGCMGLLSAIERYDDTREAKFSTYAMARIRGAIIDELRNHDMLGRVTRDRVNRIAAAEQQLINEGRDLTNEAIAEAAGLTMDEYWDAESGKQATRMVSLNTTVGRGGDDEETAFAELLAIKRKDNSPSHAMETAEIIDLIYSMLDEKEQLLVVLYYQEELTLKEIGVVMQVSESRICQMHTAMVNKIKRNMIKKGIYM